MPAAYGGLAVTILLVVAVLALVVAPPAPPSIAEYAPQATENIEESPPNQSSRFGEGEGACAEGQVCEAAAAESAEDVRERGPDGQPKRTIDVKRVRRCVGEPARQTEDPQSPPCVNYFEGDNGGNTARGVTRNEIVVAVASHEEPEMRALLPHFNDRYELYGRKLRLVKVRGPTLGVSSGAAVAEGADEVGAFAMLSPYHNGGNEFDSDDGFTTEAARRRIVTVGMGVSDLARADYRAMAPYAWGFRPPGDAVQQALGSFACTSLAGRKARYAGAPYPLQDRKFGIIVTQRDRGSSMRTEPLRDALGRCDVKARVFEVSGDSDDTTAMELIRGDGVTSLLSLSQPVITANMMVASSKIGYQPEWIVTGVAADLESAWFAVPADQRSHLFGIGPFNKILPPSDEPATWALLEGNPGRPVGKLTSNTVQRYQTLRLLASGIQLAGPRLTPESFARGLQAARFPNPDHGAPPFFQGGVGFVPGDFAMLDDLAVIWWGEAARSYRSQFTDAGGWCYVGRGQRYAPDGIPDVEVELFNADPGACR